MKTTRIILLFVTLFNFSFSFSQVSIHEKKIELDVNTTLLSQYLSSKPSFDAAYKAFPEVPKGILEAVSYHYTHFRHITISTAESCTGMPRVYGVMGLTLDGKNYFRNNLLTIANLSGYKPEDMIENSAINVKAFASAFSTIKNQLNITSNKPEEMLKVLMALSELNVSNETAINDYTMNLYLFEILSFLNNPTYQDEFGFPEYNIDLKAVFGENNLKIYNSPKVSISDGKVMGNNGHFYSPTNIKTACPDYNFSNCLWVASPNHYTGWNGHTVSAIAIHTVQGSYTSCINWFQNTSANASTHYVVASNSSNAGKVTQMVDESNAAWHVASENYYAIGYEHEGYVDDVSWYTATMYQTSATLTKDVCVGNNINPLRMFYRDTLDAGTALDYGLHNLGAEGSCVKIKGHQHFPSQTHTDPGPNWYWDYYFKLVNDNPTITTLTTTTGSFYDSGGASAVYGDDERKVWTIQPAGATSVTLTFSSFSLEADYDFMYIYDGATIWSPKIGRYNTTSPGTVTSSGGALTIEFRSDCLTTADGWAANWTSSTTGNVPSNLTSVPLGCPANNVQFTWQNAGTGWYIQLSNSVSFTNPYIKWVSGLTNYTGPSGFVLQSDGVTPLVLSPSTTYYWRIWNTSVFTDGPSFTTLNCDNIIPTTSISTPNTWKTADFTATFTDADNGTVEKAFYQVLDYDGTYWGANSANGFFGDNFDVIQPAWTDSAGTWNVTAGELIQSDETVNNSNIFAPLNQTLSNRYLYHFLAKVEGTGTNRRFGFHLFCDAGNQTNRGNSYFVWFRVEGQTLEFFKVSNNTFGAASKIITNVTTTPGQYYDFKITYDRISGTISVWRDNVYMGSWTDTSPYSTNGNYISFRSGNSKLTINELKVYRSRTATPTVTLNDNTKDIRYQNPNPATSSAKIKSIVVDGNYNLSAIAYHDLNVDWTSPTDVSVIDGTTIDVDTVYSTTTATSEWTASTDPNSDVAEYWYTLGSTSGGNDIVDWTNNGTSTTITLSSLTLTIGNHYYFSVKSKNGAGLWSNVTTSDGFIVSSLSYPVADFYVYEDTLYLPSATALFFNTSTNATSYSWDFGDGGTSTAINPWHSYTLVGVYNVKLVAISPGFSNDTMIRINYVHVLNPGNVTSVPDQGIKVMPNPFVNDVKIEFNRVVSGIIMISDVLGNIIYKDEIVSTNSIEINASKIKMSSGMYFFRVEDNSGKIYKAALMKE